MSDAAHGGAEPAEGVGHDGAHRLARLAFLAKALLVGLEQGQREGEPPDARDDKAHARAEHGVEAQRRAAEDEGEAHDERHGGAHVAPGIARARDRVHALVGGDVGKHGVIEGHRRVEANCAQHVDDEERERPHRDGLGEAEHEAREEEADKELDLVTRVVGERPQDRHEQCHHERRHRLGVGPRRHELGRRGARVERVEVDGHHGSLQEDERRVAHVVHDPVALELRVAELPHACLFPNRRPIMARQRIPSNQCTNGSGKGAPRL